MSTANSTAKNIVERLKNRKKVQCPVCFQDDVRDDIISHGSGIAILGYSCGCQYHVIHEDSQKMIRYDGEVFYEGCPPS